MSGRRRGQGGVKLTGGRRQPLTSEQSLYAYAHALGQKSDAVAANTLSRDELLAMALKRGINAYIVPSHGRLMATAGRRYIPTEIVSAADVERLAKFVER